MEQSFAGSLVVVILLLPPTAPRLFRIPAGVARGDTARVTGNLRMPDLTAEICRVSRHDNRNQSHRGGSPGKERRTIATSDLRGS